MFLSDSVSNVAGHHKMNLKSEIECLELIVLLIFTVFPGHFGIRTTILAQELMKIWYVEGILND